MLRDRGSETFWSPLDRSRLTRVPPIDTDSGYLASEAVINGDWVVIPMSHRVSLPRCGKNQVNATVSAPDAIEKISWQMPTYWQGENLVHFAAFKGHVGLYPGEEGVRAFAGKLGAYDFSKGSIRFPLSEPMPLNLIEEITRFRVREVEGGQ